MKKITELQTGEIDVTQTEETRLPKKRPRTNNVSSEKLRNIPNDTRHKQVKNKFTGSIIQVRDK